VNAAGPAVLLVGASIRWAAQSATAAGLDVWGIDRFGDRDTVAACRQFRHWRKGVSLREVSANFPGVAGLPIICVGGIAEADGEVERLIATGRSGKRMIGFSHPPSWHQLAAWAGQVGFSFPETVPADRPPRGERLSPNRPLRPEVGWLLKQPGQCGGLGVFADPSPQTSEPGAVYQRQIAGRSYGLVALAEASGVRLVGLTRSMHVRQRSSGRLRPFLYAGSRGPWDLADLAASAGPLGRSLQRLAELVAAETGYLGLFNIDLLHDRDGRWWALEVNLRPSASCEVLERAWQATWQLDKRSDNLVKSPVGRPSLMASHLAAAGMALSATALPTPADGAVFGLPTSRFATGAAVEAAGGRQQDGSTQAVYLKRILYAKRAGQVDAERLQDVWRSMMRSGGWGCPQASHSRGSPVVDDARSGETSWVIHGPSDCRARLADIPNQPVRLAAGEPIATLLVDVPPSCDFSQTVGTSKSGDGPSYRPPAGERLRWMTAIWRMIESKVQSAVGPG